MNRFNLNILGWIDFLFLHFLLFLIVSRFVKCKNTCLLNNWKDMGAFFWYAFLIGSLPFRFPDMSGFIAMWPYSHMIRLYKPF